MALIVLVSAAGAPGVTSAAVGLSLTWRRSVILVDADPGAHQAVLAGYLRGQLSTGKGLQRVAEAHRDRRPLAEVVSDETVPLVAEDGTDDSAGASRRLLPGFAKPANAGLFEPAWPDLADTLVNFEAAGIDVIVDAGRVSPDGLPQPLVERADLVLLVTRSNLRSIAAARGRVHRLREQSQLTGSRPNLGLLLIGENQPYGRREIGNLLQLPVMSVLAEDAASATVFSDGARRGRRFSRSPLARSLHRGAEELSTQIQRRRSQLGLADEDHDLDVDHGSGRVVEQGAAADQPAAEPVTVGASATANVWLRAGASAAAESGRVGDQDG